MDSIWIDTVDMPTFPKLQQDLHTDVLIIGGGICGMLCGYFLEQAGIDHIIVEGCRIGSGVTKNTTGKITAQHGIIYQHLIRDIGIEGAQLYLRANQQALEYYEELSYKFPIDFERKDAYTYTQKNRRKIEKEVEAVNKLGFPAEFVEHTSLPFEIQGAVRFPDQGQMHPLKLIKALASEQQIYEQTFVKDIQDGKAITDAGSIQADSIIIASHYPFLNKHGMYFMKLYQQRSYVLGIKDGPQMDGMYIDEAKGGLSFRNYGGYLLLGGGSHRTGKQGGKFDDLYRFTNIYYPGKHVLYHWATQDCMPLDHRPYIGHYSSRTENLYTASGFQKWGMTSSMVAAAILCDMIQGNEHLGETVFSPSRNMLKPQLALNAMESLLNLCMPTLKRCTHMGCAVRWNPIERSWDCPCHGSRFAENGEVLDNPANKKLHIHLK